MEISDNCCDAMAQCSSATQRTAYVLSLNVTRFEAARAALLDTGFARVERVEPVPVDDPSILAFEREFNISQNMTARKSSPRPVISVTLSHVRLWRSSTATGWTYIFEDDVSFDKSALVNVSTKRHPGDLARESDVQCVLDDAERQSEARPNPALLYIGMCNPMLPTAAGINSPAGNHYAEQLFGGHVIRSCAPLCMHAYAIRGGEMLFEQVRVPPTNWAQQHWHPLFRFNLDVMLRGYYYRAGCFAFRGGNSPSSRCLHARGERVESMWPRCLDYKNLACKASATEPGPKCGMQGLYVQNTALKLEGVHHSSNKGEWRRLQATRRRT